MRRDGTVRRTIDGPSYDDDDDDDSEDDSGDLRAGALGVLGGPDASSGGLGARDERGRSVGKRRRRLERDDGSVRRWSLENGRHHAGDGMTYGDFFALSPSYADSVVYTRPETYSRVWGVLRYG